jgi:glutathione synthase/RimK-type ligase-like ATP-grasp enzyme
MPSSKPITTIGSKALIDFPELNLHKVPAKVDTGADSSAIWTSRIKETKDGHLVFVLFNEGSNFYTGSEINSKTYKQTLVKNSSGTKELRYKVRLLMEINGRKIRAWFTLADREAMQYPVLVGRRLLKNKFIVDVGKASIRETSERRSVLVVGSELPDEEFIKAVKLGMKHPVEIMARSLHQLAFWLEPGNVKVYETITNRDIADFDLVYFKSHRRYYEFAIAAAEYLKFHKTRFFDEELLDHVVYDKLAESMRLALHGVPIPLMFCSSPNFLRQQSAAVISKLGYPFVCKEINADKSQKNYLLQSASDIAEVLNKSNPDDLYLLQRYVSNQGYIRALVLGTEVKLVIKRTAASNRDAHKLHLNTSKGSNNATLIPVTDSPLEMRQLASLAASIMHRQVAGVDLIRDIETGKWLVLEVNGAPQIYSGTFLEEKRAAFANFIDIQLDR